MPRILVFGVMFGVMGSGAHGGHVLDNLLVVSDKTDNAPVSLLFDMETKLNASDAAALDAFGHSVSISGDTAIVGAPFDDHKGVVSGSAYIYERNQGGPNNWGELTNLAASDAADGDYFGGSVSVSGDTVIVGAGGNDDAGSESGSAYIFQRDQGGPNNWGEVAKLTASDAAWLDHFGEAVSVSGDTAIVGARGGDGAGSDSGLAYIFQRDHGGPNNWGEVNKLSPSDAAMGDVFGCSVSVSGDTALVGARGDDDAGLSSGSAYIFQRDQGGPNNWGEVTKLTSSDGSEWNQFGFSVSNSGDTAIVGLKGFITSPRAKGGSQVGVADNESAYIFERNLGGPNNWGEVIKLTASDAQIWDEFGMTVSVSADTAIVGAFGNSDDGSESGSAYIFQRNQGGPDNWGEVTKLTASDAAASDQFGYSVSISGDTAIVGAFGNSDAGIMSGSAYVFRTSRSGSDIPTLADWSLIAMGVLVLTTGALVVIRRRPIRA